MTDLQMAAPDDARRLTDRIKAGVELIWQLIEEAYLTRTWAALGYASWDEYCTREFGTSRIPLPREERREVVNSLREAGLSTRAIASATGVDQSTIARDVAATDASSQRNASVGPRSVTGINGKVYSFPAPSPPRSHGLDEDSETWYGGPDEPERVTLPIDQDRADATVAEIDRRQARPEPVMLTLRTNTGMEVPYPKPQAKPTFNQSDGEGISWAAWSWNPVTGCLHGCNYCYARAIAARFTDAYPAGFTPLFHHERLDAPANTAIPAAHRDDPAWKRVFVCSMADLYGRWVPDEWIEQVHASMLASPDWQYILLTKFPARYAGLDLPKSAWVGTSVDEQKRVRIAEDAFREIDGVTVKWLSLEPLREPLEFSDLSMFDWVVIGAQTETRQPDGTVPAFMPDWEWICRITAQAKEAGCAVHWKPNLLNGRPGSPLNEYPGA